MYVTRTRSCVRREHANCWCDLYSDRRDGYDTSCCVRSREECQRLTVFVESLIRPEWGSRREFSVGLTEALHLRPPGKVVLEAATCSDKHPYALQSVLDTSTPWGRRIKKCKLKDIMCTSWTFYIRRTGCDFNTQNSAKWSTYTVTCIQHVQNSIYIIILYLRFKWISLV